MLSAAELTLTYESKKTRFSSPESNRKEDNASGKKLFQHGFVKTVQKRLLLVKVGMTNGKIKQEHN